MTDADRNAAPDLPETGFSSLVLSIAAAALAYMGKAVLPGTDKPEVDLPLAKQTIDTIEMLRAKTEGNRTAEETGLIDDLLYELRMAYVKTEAEGPAPTGRIIMPNG